MTEVSHTKESGEKVSTPHMTSARRRSMAWRGIASLAVLLAWVVFIVVFAVWWAPGLGLFQNIVILIASLVAAGIVIGIMWMAYGMRHGWEA